MPGPEPAPVIDRIRSRVTIGESGCWIFEGQRRDGYGQIWVGSRTDGTRRVRKAHEVAYESLIGPVPDGLVLDHLCRNRACVNPEHLEPTTQADNLARSLLVPSTRNARKSACPKGHPYDDENTYVDRHGKRYCRACRRLRDRSGRWKS
jgi:hypothetical protein